MAQKERPESRRLPCPACGSKESHAIYQTYEICYSSNCGYYRAFKGEYEPTPTFGGYEEDDTPTSEYETPESLELAKLWVERYHPRVDEATELLQKEVFPESWDFRLE